MLFCEIGFFYFRNYKLSSLYSLFKCSLQYKTIYITMQASKQYFTFVKLWS